MDSRDEMTWVVLELTHAGEQKAIEGNLAAALIRELRLPQDHPIFIPSITQNKDERHPAIIQLIEGYAFVASGLPESTYFAAEGRHLIKRVLSVTGPKGMRVLSVIPDSRIKSMIRKFREMVYSDVTIGEIVKIVSGKYSKMEGEIVELLPDGQIAVRIKLRSIDIVTLVSRSMLGVPGEPEETGGSGPDPEGGL